MNIKKLKEIISYLMPLQIETRSSEHNPILEVNLKNGRYVLDAEKSNYSFGTLHTIFKSTFNDLDIQNKNINSCLLLGLGGGSIIHLLQKKYKLAMPITAVEIDPVVIELGKKYFDIDNYYNLTIVNEDAFDFSKICNQTFDLIIIDLYINDEVPDKFHTMEFISYLRKMAHQHAIILFNKILSSNTAKRDYTNLVKDMTEVFGSVSLLTYKINEVTNKIICVNTGRVNEKAKHLQTKEIDIPIILFNPKLN